MFDFSDILDANKHYANLVEWLDGKFKLERLYKGSDHCFSAKKFHQLCDNKGPTLTVVKSCVGNIFGGYASISWTTITKYHSDPKSFLFSLTDQTKHVLK